LQHVVFRGETWKEVEDNVEEATRGLNAVAKEIERAGLKVKVQVSVGSPAEQINAFANLSNLTCPFMTKHGGQFDDSAHIAPLEDFQVGSTRSRGFHFDQQFPITDLRDTDIFDSKIFYTVQHRGFHFVSGQIISHLQGLMLERYKEAHVILLFAQSSTTMLKETDTEDL
jgi:hypothetical protein